jgi:hypothetical protein
MEKETLKKIFNFLEKNDNRNVPFIWKLLNNEPFTEEELNIKGDLDLTETNIKSLPNGLKITGNLILTETDMRFLPEGLLVGGHLDLYASKIDSLPKGLKVGGDLNIEGTYIELLPRGLQVGGDLYLNDSDLHHSIDYNDSNELRDIVKKMVEPGFIKGKVIFDDDDD